MVRIEKWLKFFIIVGSVSAVVVSVLSLIDIKREVREKIAAAEIADTNFLIVFHLLSNRELLIYKCKSDDTPPFS